MKKSSTPTLQIKLNAEQAAEVEAKAQFRGDISKSQFYIQCLIAGIRAAKAIKPVEVAKKPTRVEEVKAAVVKKAAAKPAKKVAQAPAAEVVATEAPKAVKKAAKKA